MAKQKQPERWEAATLAAAMAVAGTLFLFDKLGSLIRPEFISLDAVLHMAPVLLTAIAVGLLLAEPVSRPEAEPRRMEERSL